MKVKVEDLKPNPYRNMEKYPIDREKTESLKISINETTFWDNLLARKVDGEIQIAYGHHRLLALQELRIEEIDIPIKPIDNSNMIRIMANENMDQWGMNPSTTLETVRATRDYLDGELGKCVYKDSNKSIRVLFESEHAYNQTKNKGVGQTTILKFLGGNWKQWMIQEALSVLDAIKEKILDTEDIESLPSMTHVMEFTKAAKKFPKDVQKRVAKDIKAGGIFTRDVPDTFERVAATMNIKPKEVKKKEVNPNTILAKVRGTADILIIELKQLQDLFNDVSIEIFAESNESGLLMDSLKQIQKQHELLINKIENNGE